MYHEEYLRQEKREFRILMSIPKEDFDIIWKRMKEDLDMVFLDLSKRFDLFPFQSLIDLCK